MELAVKLNILYWSLLVINVADLCAHLRDNSNVIQRIVAKDANKLNIQYAGCVKCKIKTQSYHPVDRRNAGTIY